MNYKMKVNKVTFDALTEALKQTEAEKLLLVHAAMTTGTTDKRWANEVQILNSMTLWELAELLVRGFEVG